MLRYPDGEPEFLGPWFAPENVGLETFKYLFVLLPLRESIKLSDAEAKKKLGMK